MSTDPSNTAERARLLCQVADALGVSVEAVLGKKDEPGGIDDLAELVLIWSRLTDAADRREVLTYARGVADGSGRRVAGA